MLIYDLVAVESPAEQSRLSRLLDQPDVSVTISKRDGAVVGRYGKSVESKTQKAILSIAQRYHVERCGGRALWIGDEFPLCIPVGF